MLLIIISIILLTFKKGFTQNTFTKKDDYTTNKNKHLKRPQKNILGSDLIACCDDSTGKITGFNRDGMC